MRRLIPLCALAALLVAGAGAALVRAQPAAPAGGVIVFASDRAKFDPGEIYSLAAGAPPRDVSRSLAGDYGLAVAPRGDLIAFWSGRSGRDRVYLARSDGTGVRLVRASGGTLAARTTGSGGPLVFSADGAHVYATSYSTDGTFVIDARRALARPVPTCHGIARPSPSGELVACGTNARTVVSDLSGHVRFTLLGGTPVWSSRGWLTVVPIPGVDRRSGRTVVADAAGTLRGRLTGLPLAWSPDGRWLVLQRGAALWIAPAARPARARLLLRSWGGGELSFTPDSRAVSVAGDDRAELIPLAGGPASRGLDYGTGTWSRDGRLAYADYAAAYAGSGRAGVEVGIYITDTHGRNPRLAGRFPFDDHGYSELQWLPGGGRVLYVTSTTCGGSGLFAVPAGGGSARPLTRDPRSLETPAWSPDGRRIAVSVQRFACHLGVGLPVHIETVAADGSQPRRVTDDGDRRAGSYDRFPSFSPDGGRVAFAHGTEGSVSLEVAAIGGGDRRLLHGSRDVSAAPAWSPDGTRIAYADGRSVVALPAGGGAAQVLARGLPGLDCGSGGVAWSPDGHELALGGDDGIYLLTVGRPGSLRLAIRARCAGSPAFSPDGRQIAFDSRPPHALGEQTAIMLAGSDGTHVRTLSTVPFRESSHPAWRP